MNASKIVHDFKDTIIEKWLDKLKKTFPQVKKYGKSAIEDDVPELLDALIEVLESNSDEALHFAGSAHGRQRTHLAEYSLLHVIREYRLLKHVIFQVLDERQKISTWERDKVMYAIDQATEDAAEKYFHLEKQKVINEKERAEASAAKFQLDDELRDDFINAVSHDLNNPINNIKVAVQLMQEELVDDNNQKLLKIIQSNTSKAEGLLRDLLDVNRVNAGARLPLSVKECDLVEMLEESVENFRLKYGKIDLKASEPHILVKLDCAAMTRAVDNLIDNAFKYGDNKQPVVVEGHRKDSIVEIAISNYGQAIPLEQQAHIFSRFYRIDETQIKGWGLGLPLVKAITEAHGGKVSVSSVEGEPIVFKIQIPADTSPYVEKKA